MSWNTASVTINNLELRNKAMILSFITYRWPVLARFQTQERCGSYGR